MGALEQYKCNNCDYFAQVSGGKDAGMLVLPNTVLCEKCKEIVDVSTKSTGGMEIDKSELNIYPNCNSGKHIKKWDTEERPCPKCDGKLGSSGEVTLLWD